MTGVEAMGLNEFVCVKCVVYVCLWCSIFTVDGSRTSDCMVS